MFEIGTDLGLFLKGTLAATWTNGMVLCIVVVWLAAVACAWNGWKRGQKYVEYAPGLMTSLGIFGTFVGIVVGLMNFNINLNAIDTSIAHLLDGLKTAFITSVAGLFGAITFHFLDATFFDARRQRNQETHEATPDDIHAVLGKQLEVLGNMHTSLAGSEEGSLVGQIKLLKSDVKDFNAIVQRNQQQFQERLWKEFHGFAEMLAESATKQVIQALENVVKDFNKNLTEQFGENFKALDASVKKMVDWQIEYKTQMETMAGQYQQSVDSLVETRAAVSGIWEECKQIPIVMAELQSVLQVNQHQIQELGRHLDAFAGVRDKAVEAVPTIHARLEEIGNQLVEGSENMHAVLLQGATGFQDSVNATNSAMTGMATTVGQEAEKLVTLLDDSTTGFGNTVRDSLARLEGSSKEVHEGFGRLVGDIATHSGRVHAEMEASIGKVHQSVQHITEHMTAHEQRLVEQIAGSNRIVQQGIDRIAGELGTHADTLRQRMEAGVQTLDGGIRKMAEEMDAHARRMHQDLSKSGEALSTEVGRMGQELAAHTAKLREQMAGVVQEYETETGRVLQSFQGFGKQLEQETQRVTDAVMQQVRVSAEKTMANVVAQIDAAGSKATDTINAELRAMDRARTEELNRVISDLGSALTSITKRFADDYSRFTTIMTDYQKRTTDSLRQ